MPIKRYSAVVATEFPMLGRRYVYNREEEKLEIRIYDARLTVSPSTLFARLDTPNGVQVLWSHQAGEYRSEYVAIGRVEKMESAEKN